MEAPFFVPGIGPGLWHETSLLVRRSRFLTQITRVGSSGEARAFVERMRIRHADATHNCWAFVAGPAGSTAQIGASDDGEPHGTAGRPMLQVLLHSNVGELCAVVTRWFGGVKLGTGGLVRAYQDSVAACLDTLPKIPCIPLVHMTIVSTYPDQDRIRRLMARSGADIVSENYTEEVLLEISLPAEKREQFLADLASTSDGRAHVLPSTPTVAGAQTAD